MERTSTHKTLWVKAAANAWTPGPCVFCDQPRATGSYVRVEPQRRYVCNVCATQIRDAWTRGDAAPDERDGVA